MNEAPPRPRRTHKRTTIVKPRCVSVHVGAQGERSTQRRLAVSSFPNTSHSTSCSRSPTIRSSTASGAGGRLTAGSSSRRLGRPVRRRWSPTSCRRWWIRRPLVAQRAERLAAVQLVEHVSQLLAGVALAPGRHGRRDRQRDESVDAAPLVSERRRHERRPRRTVDSARSGSRLRHRQPARTRNMGPEAA